MNVLLLGSGGRESAIAFKIAQSSLLTHLYIAPGNPGTKAYGENVNIKISDFDAIGKFAQQKKVDLVIVGPEQPLVDGIADHFAADEYLKKILMFGPSAEGAKLEGSKLYSKAFMQQYDIPTAASRSFTSRNIGQGLDHIDTLSGPMVIKADGLAAGKGVIITSNKKEAKDALKDMLSGKRFGDAGTRLVIEDFLEGQEVSVFVIVDGKHFRILPAAKDYKRARDGDEGPNTGGMGAVSPVPYVDEEFLKKVEDRIIKPTIDGLQRKKVDYRGFLFLGLMVVNGEPIVIEYNCRLGDPESEVVLPLLESDLLELIAAAASGKLGDIELKVSEQSAATVMLVSKGYPGKYKTGHAISGTDKVKDALVFHAGTAEKDGNLVTSGGRVIAVTALGDTLQAAVDKAYEEADKIKWEGKNCRMDIGSGVLSR